VAACPKTAASALSILLALSAAAPGCGKSREAAEAPPGDRTRNGGKMQKPADRPTVEPLDTNRLLPFLAEVEGWTGQRPDGSRAQLGEWRGIKQDLARRGVTAVSRTYVKTAGEARVAVAITDGGYLKAVYSSFNMMSRRSQETPEGQVKGVSVAGFPAIEQWRSEGKHVELTVLVGNRFLVHLKSEGLEPAAVHDWLVNLRLEQLAGLQ
jgi:hypothetical protein